MLGGAGVPLGRETPPEHGLRKGAEIGQVRNRTCGGVERPLRAARAQEPLTLDVTPVEDSPRSHQRRRRHHETRRPDKVDPLAVREDCGVERRHGAQLVSGQRYTSPTGSTRWARTS